ncbi:hypothetical protein E4P41_09735 [Geodermatophilus sp. DF01-2]|uniref:hypothetical protein n=1 Tax=Geodermatophilus sp. DF01-2 TaxID=2559610 RepID=UPI00107311F9|nr:hypothetical protein [Geodermatophilus sp. DF01_2]TFV61291.1 hypothetical protein E4P41_09735 [Geodermatophilus sp. DF01_2]
MATVVLLVAVAAGLSACSSATACTEVGCGSQVTFDLEYDLEAGDLYLVEVCVDDFCRTQTLEVPEDRDGALPVTEVGDLGLQTDRDIIYLALPDERDWSGTHVATLAVRDAEGRVVSEHEGDVDFESVQPNGTNCPPVCWLAEVNA